MSLLIPSPPGYASGFADRPQQDRVAPSPDHVFVIGVLERGDTGQITGPGGVTPIIGARTNNSAVVDAINALLAERVAAVNVARVVGPAAVAATLTIGTSLRVTADNPGTWGNALKAQITGTGSTRQVVITEGTTVVATTAASTTTAGLATRFPGIATIEALSATLPTAGSPGPLTGGDSDLAGITPASYAAAAAKLDRNLGPGPLLVPGVTSVDVHTALLPHLLSHNRRARFELDLDVTENEAAQHSLTLAAANPDAAERWDLDASYGYAQPVAGEPERLISWSTFQAAVTARTFRELGVGPAPFGPNRGVPATITRLAREFTTLPHPGGEVQRLYQSHVNVAVDRVSSIHLEGFRSGSRDELLEDSHACFVRMVLAWRGEQLALNRIGDQVDRNTIVDYGGDVIALCQEFVKARAFDADRDAGFRVDIDSVNNADTRRARSVYALVHYRPMGSTHWAAFLVGAARPQETL